MPRLTQTLRAEYTRLFNTCVIRPERIIEIERVLAVLLSHQLRYRAVGARLGVPWYVIAAIHNLESSLRFDRHLHNGDSLSARTQRHPPGRPRKGTPPFTWEESARDALTLTKLHRWNDWTVAGTLYRIERYNGWGYRRFHPDVLTPYLWGGSEHYESGKYVADGAWSQTAVSQQMGAAVLLRRMTEHGLIDLSEDSSLPVDVPLPLPSAPLLYYTGGRLLEYGDELQQFLNRLPGIYLRVDGRLGMRTSTAFLKATGYYLMHDPRPSPTDTPSDPPIRYTPSSKLPFAAELQRLLDSLPGIDLAIDGRPGPKTSAAFKLATGYYLKGDRRK